MATKGIIGGYDEVQFVPLMNHLRSVSADDTPLQGEYVGFYSNVYDMIASKEDAGKIGGLKYDPSTNSFIVTYIDGTTEVIKLTDTYLLTATYSTTTGIATFVMNNGEIVKLDLNELRNEFYTKQEIDEMIENIDSIKWGKF